jgi:hypothetical protein
VSDENQRLGACAFVIGGLSFVPLVGVVFGAIAIAWGLVTRKAGGRRLAQIAAAGATFAVTISAGVYYVAFVERGGVYDRLRLAVAQGELNALVGEIELYKDTIGHYPASLAELHKVIPRDSHVSTRDPTDMKPGTQRGRFYYERLGADHYVLRSAGLDGKPFTADDIVPQVDPASSTRLGLLLRPPAESFGAGAPQP